MLSNPLKVIKAAEHCQMLHEVTEQVVQRAEVWHSTLPPVRLFINLHPDELRSPKALLASLAPLFPYSSRTILEITEHNQMTRNSDWEASITGLKERGFQLAVDDLGSGYNSLSVLAALQPAFIKIDMSIVRDVDSNPYKQRLIRILSQLGEGTGSEVLAEGVETEEELAVLLRSGVTLLQGYHLGRPSAQPDLSRYSDTEMRQITEAA